MRALLDQARAQYQTGHPEDALALYHEALNLTSSDSDALEAWEGVFLCHLKLKQDQHALMALNQAIEQFPDKAILYNNQGNLLLKKGQSELAIQAFHKAIELNPSYAIAYNNLGNAHLASEDLKAAEQDYLKALSLQADYVDAYVNLARLYLIKADPTPAIGYLEKVLKIAPNHPRALGLLSQIYMDAHQPEQALPLLTRRLSVEPNHAATHHTLGICYLKLKQPNAALPHFEQACQMDPFVDPELQFHWATALLETGQPNEALKHYLLQIEHNPTIDSFYNIGVLLADKNHLKDALSYFNEVLQQNPQHLAAYLNSAAIYLKQNQIEQAIDAYEKARALDPNNPEIQHVLAALTGQKTPEKAPQGFVKQLFDQYAGHYDDHLQQYLEYKVPELLHRSLLIEANVADPKWRVLDLGCGTGLSGEAFQSDASHLIGIDLSPEMIEIARKKQIYHETWVGDIESALARFPHQDVIVAADVFPYLGDLESVFSKAYEALNPGGYLAFTVEKTHHHPYTLQKTIRYAHSEKYIRALAKKYRFSTSVCETITLRKQFGASLEGFLCILQRKE